MHSENSQQRVLVVDDESGIRDGLRVSLEQLGYDVATAESGEAALKYFKDDQRPISFMVTDFKMPGISGFDLLKQVKKVRPSTRVVVMTGYGSIHHAVEAMQMGADDYLPKPFKFEDLEKMIIRNGPSISGITTVAIYTQDANFMSLLRKAERAAKSTAPILIEGPSGTGKELLARQIHDWSNRRDKSWVAINCAALPAGLLESELFGYEKGAFTGATERKPGRFEQADGGSLLLDEIGELDPILQAKLLRVLQEGEVDRLGGRKPQKVDVRIIATTNKTLERLVQEGKFREDLYFRLYGVRLQLPPLKDRRGDIRPLADEFLNRQTAILGRPLRFQAGVLDVLENRSWSGNIRELERAIERAAVLSDEGLVRLEHFEFERAQPIAKPTLKPLGQGSMKDMEKEIILKALEAHSGNRTHTAKALGMSLRTLRHKLKLYRDSGEAIAEYQGGVGSDAEVQDLPGPILPTENSDAELGASLRRPGIGHPFA